MAKRWRRKVLLAKVRAEGAARADPAAADAILASNIVLQPVEAETANRELERPYYGASADINYNIRQRLSFDVDFAAGGAAGTPPGWGNIIRACGMSETVDASGDADDHVLYKPITGAEPQADFFLFIDGVRHRLDGCRGTWTLNFALGIPRIRFEFTGVFADPSDTPNVAPDAAALQKFQAPRVPSRTNTPEVSLHGADVALANLQVQYGTSVVARDIPGAASIEIVDRQPSGQITVDAPDVAAVALVRKAKDGESGAFQMIHGVGAGNILQLDMPKLQLSSPSYSDADGYWQVQANIRPLPMDGNDEISITVK